MYLFELTRSACLKKHSLRSYFLNLFRTFLLFPQREEGVEARGAMPL